MGVETLDARSCCDRMVGCRRPVTRDEMKLIFKRNMSMPR